MFDLFRTIRFAGGVLGFAAMTVGSYYAMDEFEPSTPTQATRGFSNSSDEFAVKDMIGAQEESRERYERAELTGDYADLNSSE